jgi:hypothetical protein
MKMRIPKGMLALTTVMCSTTWHWPSQNLFLRHSLLSSTIEQAALNQKLLFADQSLRLDELYFALITNDSSDNIQD